MVAAILDILVSSCTTKTQACIGEQLLNDYSCRDYFPLFHLSNWHNIHVYKLYTGLCNYWKCTSSWTSSMGCENKSFLNIFLKKLYAKLYLMATVLYANFCRESNVIRSNPMVAVLPHYNSRSYTIIFTSLKKKFSVNQKVTQNVNIHVYSKFAINPFLIIKPFK